MDRYHLYVIRSRKQINQRNTHYFYSSECVCVCFVDFNFPCGQLLFVRFPNNFAHRICGIARWLKVTTDQQSLP